MPSPTTALSLIKKALGGANVLASGEEPTADEANDALDTLNDILENWSTEKLSVWGRATQSFNTIGGQASYTIGAGGDFNTERPVGISSAYVTFNGVDFPVFIIGQDEYNAIPLKSMQQPIPERLLYVNEYPFGKITLFPAPSQAVLLNLNIDRIVTAISSVSDTISFPTGYAKALRYALQVELCNDYGVQVDPIVLALAKDAKGDIKRANKTPIVSSFDSALLGSGYISHWQRGY